MPGGWADLFPSGTLPVCIEANPTSAWPGPRQRLAGPALVPGHAAMHLERLPSGWRSPPVIKARGHHSRPVFWSTRSSHA